MVSLPAIQGEAALQLQTLNVNFYFAASKHFRIQDRKQASGKWYFKDLTHFRISGIKTTFNIDL